MSDHADIVQFAQTVVSRPEEWAWMPYGKDLAAAVIALVAERDEARRELHALYCSDDEYALAYAASDFMGKDRQTNKLHESCVGYRLRAEAAEAELQNKCNELLECVIEKVAAEAERDKCREGREIDRRILTGMKEAAEAEVARLERLLTLWPASAPMPQEVRDTLDAIFARPLAPKEAS